MKKFLCLCPVMEIACLIRCPWDWYGMKNLRRRLGSGHVWKWFWIGTRTTMDRMLRKMRDCSRSLIVMTRPVLLLLGKVPFRPLGQCLPRQLFLVARSSLCFLPEMDFWTKHFVIWTKPLLPFRQNPNLIPFASCGLALHTATTRPGVPLIATKEPSSKRPLTADGTTGTISSNFDTTNLQNFDEISSTAYAEVGPGSVSEISSDSRTESESISEQVNFLKGKFLSTNALLGVLNSATETLTEIPRTVKENVYFVLDRSSNISKKTNNTRMDHWDNCGIWETTSTSLKTTYFVRQVL